MQKKHIKSNVFRMMLLALMLAGFILGSRSVSASSDITNGSFYVGSDSVPELAWNFKSTDANDTHDSTNLKFKVVVSYDGSDIETEYKDYSSYKNNTTILVFVKFSFGSSDVAGGERITFTIYAYNGTIATANLLDTSSGSAYLPNWGGSATSATTTTTAQLSNWYYVLIPVGVGAFAVLAFGFFRWYNKD